jgi:two-component system CheB/CheR fusion protein
MSATQGPSSTATAPLPNPDRWNFAVVLLATIFFLDWVAPANVHVPALYVLPTLLFIWARRFKEPFVAAAIATVLTVVGLYLSGSEVTTVHVLSRLVAIGIIWATAAGVVSYLRVVERWSRQVSTTNEALKASFQRLEELRYALDKSAIVAATDQRGEITYVNEKFCEISKYSQEELLGQDHRIINSQYHSKDFIRSLWRTIANGQVWRGELRNRAKDGSFYWVDTTIVPFLNEQGKPRQYLSIRNDITQRKLAEAKLRDEAAFAQLGRLSAVVAHEVRNPLAGLKGSLQVLAGRLPSDLPGREIVPPMIARIDALERTVRDILAYSRPIVPKPQHFDVHRLIVDAAAAARASAKAAELVVEPGTSIVYADPEMVRAALLNLLLNACEAGGDGPVVVRQRLGETNVEIVISDAGPGLPAEVREQLFEPFVTTKPGGTGLGLPIARRLTQAQGGDLSLEANGRGGTDAVLRLPTSVPVSRPPASQTLDLA